MRFKIIVFLFTVFSTLYSFGASSPYKKIAFYVAAHQDDWQLFMGEKAYRDLKDPKTHVIFLFVTSGEAGKDFTYWNNRDRAAANCLAYVFGRAFKDSFPTPDYRSFREHKIEYRNYKNATSYYMRLPDGHGRAGIGYESYGNQSLKKFRGGEFPHMTTTDSSSTYNSWNEIVLTIKDIIVQESALYKNISVHFPEYDNAININSHSDHLAAGQLTYEAVKDLSHMKRWAYIDYHTQFLPANLSDEDIMIKSALYAVYDKSIFDRSGYCTICDGKGQYTQWLFRSYYREIK